jgi:hypothetical protein
MHCRKPPCNQRVDDRELAAHCGIVDFNNQDIPMLECEMVFLPYCAGDVFAVAATVNYQDSPDNNVLVQHHDACKVRFVLEEVMYVFLVS